MLDAAEVGAPRLRAAQLAATDLRLSAVLDGVQDLGIFLVDPDGRIATWNAGMQRLHGFAVDEAVGRQLSICYIEGHRAHGQPARDLEAARTEGRYDAETWRVRPDGSLFWAHVVITPLLEDGHLVGFGVVTRDITDRIRHLSERAESHDRSVQVELAQERRKLEARAHQSQRLETVGQLAGGIAHDFNNLLAGISSYVDLVSSSLAREMVDRGLLGDAAFVDISRDIEEIGSVATRAAALTRQLLTFSRREVVQRKVLDLRSVVGELQKLLSRTIGEGIELRSTHGPDVPPVLADRGHIEQVCMNLAVNARDAMPTGGVLTIETSEMDIAARAASGRNLAPGRYARLTVRDTGEGMTADVADRAFEPYFSTKPKERGSGLGLATVYGIATQAGGDVVIESRLGRGTAVHVLLPATDQRPDEVDLTPTNRPPRGRGETILLVEDEIMVREPARRLLARSGYTVLAAAGADEALALLGNGDRIDLLLTDVVMAGRSGKELADDVRVLTPATRIVFMSGYSEAALGIEGVLDDGVTLIQKPFTAATLLRTLRGCLDRSSP